MPDDHPWAEEPWKWKDEDLYDADDIIIMDGVWMEGGWLKEADGIRIAACVSACAGVPTEDLLAIANGHMIACKHCGHNYRVPFQGKESVFDGVLLKCPSCKKESEWPKEEWPTVKEAPDDGHPLISD